MAGFVLTVDDYADNGTELLKTEDEYDFFIEALTVTASLTSMAYVDNNRRELAEGKPITYILPNQVRRVVTIVES